MIFKIYFYPGKRWKEDGKEPDFFFLRGETIEDIKEQNEHFFKSRGLDIDECFAWSEEMKSDI